MLRVVLDANVFVSALVRPTGPPGRIVARIADDESVKPIVSPAILAEVRRCLTYPRVRRYVRLTADEIDAWLDAIAVLADLVDDRTVPTPIVAADPDDDKDLLAALEGRATFVVSGDAHLLALGTHEGVTIVSPRKFQQLLAAQEEQ